MGPEFWNGLLGAFIGTIVGGFITTIGVYLLSHRNERIKSAHQFVDDTLDHSFTEKRRQAKVALKRQKADEVALSDETQAELFETRNNVLDVLNRHEIMMDRVRRGSVDKKIVREFLWPLIISDFRDFDQVATLIEFEGDDRQARAANLSRTHSTCEAFCKEWGDAPKSQSIFRKRKAN